MANAKIVLVTNQKETATLLENAILGPAGYQVTRLDALNSLEEAFQTISPDLVIYDPPGEGETLVQQAARLLDQYPCLPVILLLRNGNQPLESQALRQGFSDCLPVPVRPHQVLAAVQHSLKRKQRLDEWMRSQSRRDTKTLQRRVDGLEAISRVGRSMTALLDLDNVLKSVVDAAVDLTGAEEGSLLLLDEKTGELVMRAARNFDDEFVRTFRLPVRDTLPGQVLRTGQPVLVNLGEPQKIKTSYFVYTALYVPLFVHGRTIGVLGVDNQHSGRPIAEHHLSLMAAMSDYAAIAIENASLYTRTEVERKRLEKILTQIGEAVIISDPEGRILMLNATARACLGIPANENLAGKLIHEVVSLPDLLHFLNRDQNQMSRTEVTVEDGRIFNAQRTCIPEIGTVVTMQDITHLKELDRIKSEFVSTVSHDLRSPLTAILGYVELIDRVGALNDMQREFVRRVQGSVHSITSLINDLLDLGRIEAGFDIQKESVPVGELVQYTVDELSGKVAEKNHRLELELAANLPAVLGNPTHLRQMIANLLVNAIGFTPPGGKIAVRAWQEAGQVILQVTDNGPGISPSDQPYIFDKFYRGANVRGESQGTGLGLAIVKSIVENHQGRIWVDSQVGAGATFTIVLPAGASQP